jgi:hypothetical protein
MLAVRFSEEDRQLLNALIRHKAEQLAGEGVEVTAASVLRSLVRQAAADIGISVSNAARDAKKRR